MPFPFSFRFSVPGIVNPFQPACDSDSASLVSRFNDLDKNGNTGSQSHSQKPVDHHRRRPSPSPHPPKPLVRKRGWVPSESEPSLASTKPISTSGYLDTPAKYRDMAQYNEDDDEIDEMVADLPAPKRRKTLAGSIVSTALSAALIGTAVGLTVYRLWRDRGRHPELLPPPPYEQGEWLPPNEQEASSSKVPMTHVTPPTPRYKKQQRHVAGRRPAPRHRKVPTARNNAVTPPASSPPPSSSAFDFSAVEEEQPDDQMDWMGDRLQQLIEEGKRALGREVVVMSESKEDEVDDGSGAWEEEEQPTLPPSRSGSIRRGRRPRNIGLPDYAPPTYATPQTSPRKSQYGFSHSQSSLHLPESPRRTPRGTSVESSFGNHLEPEDEWGTPELRESMARAREMYKQRIGQR
ncbi:hypothetical protein EIP91_008978 [Steccherinum ochraceum]|uniref:Uncharacterized protein n=1 Tax=Steccherinum ochraceum TaxID=92696 RepID=A0A4R0RK77_9APHY|nr:hypothetical protein EIP91_008978 [Steccherinum ochraceum]